MTNSESISISCQAAEPLLVDFADEVLAGSVAEQVRQHIDQCATCRQQVAALTRSLRLAQSVWEESAAGARRECDAPCRSLRPMPSRGPAIRWVACAGAILVAVVLGWRSWTATPHHPTVHDDASVSVVSPADAEMTTVPQASRSVIAMDEVEALIRRQEQAARLAASLRILSEAPNIDEDVARAEHYLKTTYGVTAPNESTERPSLFEGI